MLRGFFGSIPDVTKNLLILNVLFFFATVALEPSGIDLRSTLAMHYPSSPFFEPYQIITHFFMHGDLRHIFSNMLGLIIFGSHLERLFGKKRYFTFYIVTALGAAFLHFGVQAFEIYQLTGQVFPYIEITNIEPVGNGFVSYNIFPAEPGYQEVAQYYFGSVVGASGAVYGLLAGAALLSPNSELHLLFFPFPIKFKWFALCMIGFEVYRQFDDTPNDSIAHLAHLGGALFAFILIQIWKKDRHNFY